MWLFPIFFLSVIGWFGGQSIEGDALVDPFDVAVVNGDPTFETKMVIRQFSFKSHIRFKGDMFLIRFFWVFLGYDIYHV